MSRFRIAIIVVAAVLAVLLLITGAGGVVTRTDYGRERVRGFLASWLSSRVHGSMYIGRITGGFVRGVTVDSLEIRDDRGELFIASGPATIRYDVRDLFDRRALLSHVELSNPVVHFREYHDGSWNFRRIFPGGQPSPIGPRRGFDDYVVIDSASISNGHITLSLPWRAPAGASSQAAARLLREALAEPGGNIRQTRHGPVRVFEWRSLDARLGHTRLAHPDTIGRVVTVRQLATVTSEPPFVFSDVHGVIRQLGDSVWLDAPRWRLPGSSGRAAGKIVWGGGRPTRYSINIRADTASLADLAWIDPYFPRQGGGRGTVDVRNAAHDERIIEFAVSDLDVRSHRSHVTGRLVVDPTGPVLVIRDVAMRAAALDFELLRAVNGGPFPYDWQGAFSGTLLAAGGRLDRFRVDRADLTFADANVRGATAAAVASGVLDITDPGFTVFHGLHLDIRHLDLRTPRAVIPDFVQLSGHVSGRVTLDSLWMDVRVRDADLVHRDGAGPVSHVTGSGRVTLAEPNLRYDLELFARPVSFTTLGRSYPGMPLTGEFTGPVRVRGEAPRLLLSTALDGPGGRLTFDGTVDAELPVYGANGSGSFTGVDVRRVLRGVESPSSRLTGRYEVAVSAADLATATGSFAIMTDASRVRDVRVLSSLARGRFDAARLALDTVTVRLRGGVLAGSGTVALDESRAGTLRFAAAVDSIGELGQLLGDFVDSVPRLSGALTAAGELRTGASAGLTGEIAGRGLTIGEQSAQRVEAVIDLSRSDRHTTGTISVAADSVDVRGVEFTRVQGAARLPADLGGEGAFRGSLRRASGGVVDLAGRLEHGRDTSTVRLDTLTIRVDSSRSYSSRSTSGIRVARGHVGVDSLIIAPMTGAGSLVVRDLTWSRDSIGGSISSRDTDLAMLSGLVPELARASGPMSVELTLAGSREKPRARGAFRVTNGSAIFSGARYERLTANVELNDTWLHIRQLSAETPRGGGRRGTARVQGTIDMSDGANPVFDLEATARAFRAVDRRGFATLDISTEPSLLLTGPYRAATLRGSLIVDEGSIYLPERLDKDIADLSDPELLTLVDTTVSTTRSLLPSAPSEFVSNLRLDDVDIVLGDDVWLRSSEANVELGGGLRVTRTRSGADDRPQLALVGTLNAVRGTYVLNLAVAQPTFHVERGTLRFFGTPDLNPSLDIRAIHTVRQPRRTLAREDVRILAAITGTLHSPQLSLSSADSLTLSQSDMLSYLVTGEPAFALSGTSTEYAEQLLTLGGRLAGTFISARIPRHLFDIVEVRTAAVRLESGASRISSSYLNTLYNTRVILGKQLSERWYVGLSTGFCRSNFTESLGLHLEYRFSSTYFAQGGIEPGSGDVACVGTTTARTFQQTPPQLGVDLFRSWRF